MSTESQTTATIHTANLLIGQTTRERHMDMTVQRIRKSSQYFVITGLNQSGNRWSITKTLDSTVEVYR